jgi:hypothetical protein
VSDRALDYYERACRGGVLEGRQRAAALLSEPSGDGREAWTKRQRQVLELGCTLEERSPPPPVLEARGACWQLGLLDLAEKPESARRLFERGCRNVPDNDRCSLAFEERLRHAELSRRSPAARLACSRRVSADQRGLQDARSRPISVPDPLALPRPLLCRRSKAGRQPDRPREAS